MRGYTDNDGFIYIEEADYQRWIDNGRNAVEAGAGGDDAVDATMLQDLFTSMLHYARLAGMVKTGEDAEALVSCALMHFNAENPTRLRPWMKELL